jgi:threonylcarbamoyladenosine tRNA methylthiotransferase MtaB
MFNNKKVAFTTLGCKLNFSETSIISRKVEAQGFVKTDFNSIADVYVINTCTVTDNADKKFKQIVKQALKRNSEAMIVAIGCYAQLKPEELADVYGVDLVLGIEEKFKLPQYLGNLVKKQQAEIHACEVSESEAFFSAYSAGDRTRSFLKIQDGCDYPCTYCTIPMARGKGRNGTVEEAVQNAKEIAQQGIKEIVITGVNIGTFLDESKGNKRSFIDLIKALDKVEGIARYRISSIEPNLLTDEIIEFVAQSEKFVPHFHIPLQSGSNTLLKLMKRRYLRELYAEKVAKIKALMPDAAIGVDVIIGFPGETDELFLETYHFVNELDIAYLHVFTYSERPNTEAVKMKGVVAKKIRNKRSKMLRGLSAKKLLAFYDTQLGKTHTVLFEKAEKENKMFGFTQNYVKISQNYDEKLVNTIQKVKLIDIDENGNVTGQIID